MIVGEDFLFNNEGETLVGVLHRAQGDSRRGIVVCYPFAEERQESHRVMVNLASDLAETGLHVLRFDLRGTGDSAGDFGQYDMEDWIADIQKAVDTLREKTGMNAVGLLGLRLGGTFAIAAAKYFREIEFLILLNPVLDVKAYLHRYLRGNLAFQMATYREIRVTRDELLAQLEEGQSVNVEGYYLSSEFYKQAIKMEPLRDFALFRGPSLIVRISGGEQAHDGLLDQLVKESLRNAGSSYSVVDEEPFWLEKKYYIPSSPAMSETTVRWLNGLD